MTAWERRDGNRSVRYVHTGDPQPRVHLRADSAPPDGPAVQLIHDALTLPRVWTFGARLGAAAPLVDHGRVIGVDVTVTALDPTCVWEQAARLHDAVRPAPVPAERAGRALERAAAASVETSHHLATLATLFARPTGPGRIHAGQLVADVVRAARRLLEEPAAVPVGVAVTAALGPDAVACGEDPVINLRRPRRPPAWLEVGSPRADLAYLQVRRAVPPVRTLRELAATLIANQAAFGPYHSALDDIVRSRAAVSYLWDCVTDLARGEFVMLAAPDMATADRVVSLIHAAHADAARPSARPVEDARRIVRTQVLRRLASTNSLLLAHGEAQRAGLPANLWTALPAALRDVTFAEVDAAAPGLYAEPLATTLVVPVRAEAQPASTAPAT
ncbi:hypothetical protein FHR32_008055 [Streptosporangium album]|uniref:Peptidase M16 inactive domain-containing protein n=1 Tax=Streptosporangium album TaxID=47479 RepID=A0A7W7S4D7_9ACTN|nr:hypothetical protein [Streptosporangium album]MBB4943655.1 hypothetical protein [Streptosporangium album]